MKNVEIVPEAADEFAIGQLVGERKTLSKLAGSCSAAEALCLRTIRESKQYLSKVSSWEEFCPRYLGMNRSTADRLIRHLEEFGPESFTTMQQLGLTPKQYRALAPRLEGNTLLLEGEAIELCPENGPQIHAALRRFANPPAEEPPIGDRLNSLAGRCREVLGEFEALYRLRPGEEDRRRLAETLKPTITELTRLSIEQHVPVP